MSDRLITTDYTKATYKGEPFGTLLSQVLHKFPLSKQTDERSVLTVVDLCCGHGNFAYYVYDVMKDIYDFKVKFMSFPLVLFNAVYSLFLLIENSMRRR